MKIILACAGGMSTGMLVQKMKESASSQKIEVEIVAVGLSELEEHVSGADIILLGPQIGFRKEVVQNNYKSIPVEVIDMMDYGMMNGEKVLNIAENIIETNK